MATFDHIPKGSILGLNYSGMHDTAIAIVAPDGTPLFAAALERFSRIKQDGRPPSILIDGLPWDCITKVAVSTESAFSFPDIADSRLLKVKLTRERSDGLRHEQAFYDYLDTLPCEKEFVCHQMAHAASAFWGSGFAEALCLTYDGGMCNSPWFGGLYAADRQLGIRPLDQFNALRYAKVTSLYTFVTALLGFTPNRHEGKITGLAAYGHPTDACRALVRSWFEDEFFEIESTMEWVFAYDLVHAPILLTNEENIRPFRDAAKDFSKEELAATVQEFAEKHVLEIFAQARALGWVNENACLAGGLFANVKINQRVAEAGFKRLFVAPPMTDDGTALGAAWHILSRRQGFDPRLESMYLGPAFLCEDTIRQSLESEGINFKTVDEPAKEVARLLSGGAIVAIHQGAMEFGPRALGNRSILAQATESGINRSLNEKLNRTEFMPFAPVSRMEDAGKCYLDIKRVIRAAEFMTVTVNCTDEMTKACPAVVHIDGTARPQLVTRKHNPVIHAILSHYITLTNNMALVNTSFNIHEEPMVCSIDDALQAFFESRLDYLLIGNNTIISFSDNHHIALQRVYKKLGKPDPKVGALKAIRDHQFRQIKEKVILIEEREKHLLEITKEVLNKEKVIENLTEIARSYEEMKKEKEKHLQKITKEMLDKEKVIEDLARTVRIYEGIFRIPGFGALSRSVQRARSIFRPRLGNLKQYAPRPIQRVPSKGGSTRAAVSYPRISVVTPSYEQGIYLEKTLLSVFGQNYPNLEYFVQDGQSKDGTADVLKKHQRNLSGWISEPDTGQSQALNRGFSRTSGEIMAWLNSDDLLLPGALLAVAEYFNRHPDVDVVYGDRLLIDENDMEIGRWILPGHDDSVLSWVDYVPQETLFWRRRIWDKAGGRIDESFRFAMDWDLLSRFRDAGARFGHIPRFMGAFRIHERQKTSTVIDESGRQEMERIRERSLGRVPGQKEIRKAVIPYLLRHVLVDLVYRIKVRAGSRS
jgi:predicted NodU family carbamoyl transferase